MGLDMRMNSGRCPSFLLAACVLLCIILVCNWWSFSSQNYDLIKQINFLEEQSKTCCNERDHCNTERNKLDSSVGLIKIQLDQERKGNKETIKRHQNDLTLCKTELDSLKILDESKSESLKALHNKLDQKLEEIIQLNEKITTLKESQDALQQQLKNRSPSAKNPMRADDTQANKDDDDNNINDTTDSNREDGERELEMGNNVNR